MTDARDTLFRQWTMLQRLPRYPRTISTQDMIVHLRDQGFKVTSRTVERDLAKLSTTFGYSSEEEGRSHYWFWPPDFKTIDIPGLDPSSALAFNLAERHLGHLLPPPTLELLSPYFRRADEVLNGATSSKLSGWREKVRVIGVGPQLMPASVDQELQRQLYEALLEERRVLLTYAPRGETEERDYEFSPLALVNRQSVQYLVGPMWTYENVVQLAMHRVRSVEITNERVHIPDGFDIDAYIETQREFSYPTGAGRIRLQMLFDSLAAEHLEERPLSEDQVIEPYDDDQVLVKATVLDTDDLTWWLLGFGPNVEVLKPAKLRRKITRLFKESLELYHD